MATRSKKTKPTVEEGIMVWANSPEGAAAALDSVRDVCPCNFECSEREDCRCGDEGPCPCSQDRGAYCRAYCRVLCSSEDLGL